MQSYGFNWKTERPEDGKTERLEDGKTERPEDGKLWCQESTNPIFGLPV